MNHTTFSIKIYEIFPIFCKFSDLITTKQKIVCIMKNLVMSQVNPFKLLKQLHFPEPVDKKLKIYIFKISITHSNHQQGKQLNVANKPWNRPEYLWNKSTLHHRSTAFAAPTKQTSKFNYFLISCSRYICNNCHASPAKNIQFVCTQI